LQLGDALDLAFSKGARSSKAPEDRVIFPLGVACRDIFEEILFAVSEGFGRSALRSGRTLYECVVFSRYLNRYPDKTEDYLATFHAQWAMVLKNIPDAAKAMPHVHSVILEKVPAYAGGKRIDLEWSDKKLLKMAEEVGIPNQFHAWAYNYTSGFVHPSAMFLLHHLSQDAPGEVIEISNKPQDHEAWWALRLAHCLLLNAIDLRLKYAPSTDLAARLAECKTDFARIWGCPPPI
jgi:hypothetical protein